MTGSGAREGIGPFVGRVKNILLVPRSEWRVIHEEPGTYANILFKHVAVIAAIPPVMAIGERLIFNRGAVSNAVHSPVAYVLATNVLWYLMIILNVIITGSVISTIVIRNESGWMNVRGLKLAVYSFTPSFLISILIVIPALNWLIYAALAYSVFLLYLGIRTMTGLRRQKAAVYALASFIAAGVILGGLNMFEYMFESFLAGKLFF
jgi:hypothetical protein